VPDPSPGPSPTLGRVASVQAPAVSSRPTRLAPASSRADLIARRVLLIPNARGGATDADAQRLFSTSILISALRCLLSYIVFPIVTPLVGALSGVAPIIGLPIAVLALVFDVLGIRRFFLANHRLRWPVTGIYLAVMGLVAYLLAGDIAHFV
jgi:hypothetical protein